MSLSGPRGLSVDDDDVLDVVGTSFDTEDVAVSNFAGQGGVTVGVFAAGTQNGSLIRSDYINYDTDGRALIDNDDDGVSDRWEQEGIDLTFDRSSNSTLSAPTQIARRSM